VVVMRRLGAAVAPWLGVRTLGLALLWLLLAAASSRPRGPRLRCLLCFRCCYNSRCEEARREAKGTSEDEEIVVRCCLAQPGC
jgi:hypothetical protein